MANGGEEGAAHAWAQRGGFGYGAKGTDRRGGSPLNLHAHY